MKSLTPFFKGAFRHHFWILCGVVAPVLMGGWFTTTARLQDETTKRKDVIEGQYKKAEEVRADPNHPNQASVAGLQEFIDELKEEVYAAWDHQYRRQAEILVWPKELGQDFIQKVDGIRPSESFEYSRTPDPKKELLASDREKYRDYIKNELPKLAEIIRADWTAAGASSPTAPPADTGMGGFGGFDTSGGSAASAAPAKPAVENEFLVNWDNADQSAQARRFDWSSTADKKPRTVDILYAQEDLWVLKAVMKIIADANQDATGTYNATVREILSISLGSEVGASTGSIGSGSGEDAKASWDAMWGAGEDDAGGGGGSSAGGMPGAPKRLVDPADNRYVDTEYNPIRAEDLRAVANTKQEDPNNAYLVVSKRMPIRLKLRVDSRRISRFIAACGNSDLMVEIRQVRINTEGGSAGGLSGGDDAMAMMGMEVKTDKEDDQSSGFEALGGGPGGPGGPADAMAGMLAGMEIEEEEPVYVLPVEFYGMVYIYNPVDTESLDYAVVKAEPEPAPAPAPVEPAAADPDPSTETAPTEPDTEAIPAATDAPPAVDGTVTEPAAAPETGA